MAGLTPGGIVHWRVVNPTAESSHASPPPPDGPRLLLDGRAFVCEVTPVTTAEPGWQQADGCEKNHHAVFHRRCLR